MKSTLFISDLHLDAAYPEISRQFFDFLRTDAAQAEALYILGDLFELWIGDDDTEPEKRKIAEALRALTASGVPCYVMHGNRDFLIGERFSDETGCQLLDDPIVVHLYGERVLVTHGDGLCTDDIPYQTLRATVRDPRWQAKYLKLTPDQRLSLAAAARSGSKAHMAQAAATIMDVNSSAVETAMRAANVRTLLHGHTHRPAIHTFQLDGAPATRIVLGDWYDQGSVLRWNAKGYELQTLPRSTLT